MRDIFILNGRPWQVMRQLSMPTAGSSLYLVSNRQRVAVLKTYEMSLCTEPEVLERMYNMDFELLLPIIDYGTVELDGKELTFEIGKHCVGDTLRQYKLQEGDLESLRHIALQAAAAIEYMHRNEILHLDIKPANFFFDDADHKRLVLGDFGISRICPVGQKIKVNQARTPQYAAPEMYEGVIDGIVQIGAEADYYSLGLTLLSVCLGHDVFGPDEHTMLQQKRQGRLPGLDRLSAPTRKLIQGLTAIDPRQRWGYEEVELWFCDPYSDVDDVKAQNKLIHEGDRLSRFLQEKQYMEDGVFGKELAEYLAAPGNVIDIVTLNGWTRWEEKIKQTTDIYNPANRDRLGVYDYHTSAYRLCRLLGAKPEYKMTNGTVLKTIDDVMEKNGSDMKDELTQGSLAAWTAGFFHEDTDREFGEDYEYESEVEKWVNLIGTIDPQHRYFVRYTDARYQLAYEKELVAKEYNELDHQEKHWKWITIAMALLWMLLVALVGFSDHGKVYLLSHSVFCIVLPIGLPCAILATLHAYFHGLNNTPCLLMGGLGLLSASIPVLLLRWLMNVSPSLFAPAVLLMSLVYLAIALLTDYHNGRNDRRSDLAMLQETNLQSEVVEPLHYALKSRARVFHATQQAVVDDVNDTLSSMTGENTIHYKFWSLLFTILVVLFFIFSGDLLNFGNPDLPSWHVSPIHFFHEFMSTL